jgi:transcriptional regulator with XRE-family HTH domain
MYASPSFKNFVKKTITEKGLTYADLAKAIGIMPSRLSELLNGKRRMDPTTINKMADTFGMLRTEFYKRAGWVDLTDDEQLIQRFRETVQGDLQFAKLFDAIMALDEPERSERIKLILAALAK